jgi:hypothetical protein
MSDKSRPNHSFPIRRLARERLETRWCLSADFGTLPTWAEIAPLDVNGDMVIVPLDALLVINELNGPSGVGPVESLGLNEVQIEARRKLDSNRDGFVSPMDALLVINYLNNGKPTVISEFVERSLAYFRPGSGFVEPQSGYPFEGFQRQDYTQPTAIGWYTQLLATIATGDLRTAHLSQSQAIDNLEKIADSLLEHQQTIGERGLLPWMSFRDRDDGRGVVWDRDEGEFGRQIALGDNANLSAALGATIGALLAPPLAGNQTVEAIRDRLEQFLDAQAEGYQFLFDNERGLLRRGWHLNDGRFFEGAAFHNDFGDEFRSVILFVVLRHELPDSVYAGLKLHLKPGQISSGEQVFVPAPFDGGAFQAFWPLLTMPEIGSAMMRQIHEHYVDIYLTYSQQHNLPGFLSADYVLENDYGGDLGIPELARADSPRNTDVAGLYTLGPAAAVNREAIESFLRDVLAEYPEFSNDHGFWGSYNTVDELIVREQIVINDVSRILGLVDFGPQYMTRYLQARALWERLEAIYAPGEAVDVIAAASGAFTWGDGDQTSHRAADQYVLSANEFHRNGTAFTFDSPRNLAGGQLILTYRSSTDVGQGQFELKTAPADIRLQADGLTLVNTGGQERQVVFNLPPSPALRQLREVVLLIEGGTGQPLDMVITQLHFAPAE